MAKVMHKNHIKNRDNISMSEISSYNSTMDFDKDSIKFESILTSMSCLEDNGYAESTTSITHSSINMPRQQVLSSSFQEKL